MRYSNDDNRLYIGLCEFVESARRAIHTEMKNEDEALCSSLPASELRRLYDGYRAEEYSVDFTLRSHPVRMTASIYASAEKICVVLPIDHSPKRIRQQAREYCRAIAFVSGYVYMQNKSIDRLVTELVYVSTSSGESKRVEEVVSRDVLTSFFERCCGVLERYVGPEIERVRDRLPSMASAAFPHKDMRQGQRELVEATYRAIARGKNLYASAPTGIGKTVSTLYPAIKAMGRGKCDKVFYLTPKSTMALAAAGCIRSICHGGTKIKAVVIGAKEKACINSHACANGRELCQYSPCRKMPDATIKLYELDECVITGEHISNIAREYGVCPYELSLCYAELCDVVICDVNYLFDPSVYIRRFFTRGGNYAFLIDEAHDLPDRARNMFSATLGEDDILLGKDSQLLPELSPIASEARAVRNRFYELLYPLVKDELREREDATVQGAAHLSDIPCELYTLLDRLIELCENEIHAYRRQRLCGKEDIISFIRKYCQKLLRFRNTAAAFDSCYEMFVFYENGKIRAQLYCIDTGKRIAERLGTGKCAVFFSATLTPLDYYCSLLGADASSERLELGSSFAPEQLSVSIIDSVSTRLINREQTLLSVCRIIAATVSAKRGNYIVFSPSFDYSDKLCRIFSAKYPKINIISQKRKMSERERKEFLQQFDKGDGKYLVAFCVMGGVFSEGIDLVGERLIGAVIVGTGIPALSYEREAICAYYNELRDEGKQFAYIYPGINKVHQAAGRVIRDDGDRGVIVLIDDRFCDPLYRKTMPSLWKGLKFIHDAKALRNELDAFWADTTD